MAVSSEEDWTALTVSAFGPLLVAAALTATVWSAGSPLAVAAYLLGAAASASGFGRWFGRLPGRWALPSRPAASQPVPLLAATAAVALLAAVPVGVVFALACAGLGFLTLPLARVSVPILRQKFRTRRGDARAWIAAVAAAGVFLGCLPIVAAPEIVGRSLALVLAAATAVATARVLSRRAPIVLPPDTGAGLRRADLRRASPDRAVAAEAALPSRTAPPVPADPAAAPVTLVARAAVPLTSLAAGLCCVAAGTVLALLRSSAAGRYPLAAGEAAGVIAVAGLTVAAGVVVAGRLPGPRASHAVFWCALAVALVAVAALLWPPMVVQGGPALWFASVAFLLGGAAGIAAGRLSRGPGRMQAARGGRAQGTAATMRRRTVGLVSALLASAGILVFAAFGGAASARGAGLAAGGGVAAAWAAGWLALMAVGLLGWAAVALHARLRHAEPSVPAAAELPPSPAPRGLPGMAPGPVSAGALSGRAAGPGLPGVEAADSHARGLGAPASGVQPPGVQAPGVRAQGAQPQSAQPQGAPLPGTGSVTVGGVPVRHRVTVHRPRVFAWLPHRHLRRVFGRTRSR